MKTLAAAMLCLAPLQDSDGKAPELPLEAGLWLNRKEPLTLESMRERAVLLAFVRDGEEWIKWAEPLASKGLYLVLVFETESKVAGSNRFAAAWDKEGKAAEAYSVKDRPRLFLIEPGGKVAWQGGERTAELDKAVDLACAKVKPEELKRIAVALKDEGFVQPGRCRCGPRTANIIPGGRCKRCEKGCDRRDQLCPRCAEALELCAQCARKG
jgi:hypothetical protein